MLDRCMSRRLSDVFFFQAEDGIRDYKVTGVQTCALPISRLVDPATAPRLESPAAPAGAAVNRPTIPMAQYRAIKQAAAQAPQTSKPAQSQIGRASCRERV